MKKLIAALITLPTIALANVGDDVIRFFANQGDDVVRITRTFANQGDDAAMVARGLANQGDDVARVARGFTNQGDDVARVAGGFVKFNQPEAVVYNEVHKAILSGVNKDSINDLMAIAEAANTKQYQQTGVWLNRAVLVMLVNRAGAASTASRD